MEFLLTAGDSTYWVRTVGGALQMRGSPLALARVSGRFRELYVVDDDRSFENALFVGQRLYQRDIISNDSSVVFRDTIVSALADAFLRVNPDARRLAPNEDPAEEPGLTASAEISVLGVLGPYLSLEYHVDTAGAGEDAWHMTRHAVVDLRTNTSLALEELLGADAAASVLARGRRAFQETVDSVRTDSRPAARRAARALGSFHFDPRSFSLLVANGTLMIAFSAPGAGVGGEGFAFPVRPIPVSEPGWWPEVARSIPTTTLSREERWARGPYDVRALYDSVAAPVQISVLDSAGTAFLAGSVTGPVHRIYWLDAPAIDEVQRGALTRAFDDAALYDDAVRTADARPRSSFRLVRNP